MGNRIDQKNNKFIKIIYFLFISLAMIALAGYEIMSGNVSFSEERIELVQIVDAEGYKNALVGGYNDKIELNKDIVVEHDGSFGSYERPFSGTFDGRGHTIVVNNVDTPIFNYISEDAVIKNTVFQFTNLNLDKDFFGFLALENKGTIENVHIICNVNINSSVKKIGIIAFKNYGTIKNSVLEYAINKNAAIGEVNKVYVGGACVDNYGTLSSVVVKANYSTNAFPEIIRNNLASNAYINDNTGALVVNNNSELEESIKNCLVESDINLISYYDSIYQGIKIVKSLNEELNNEFGKEKFYTTMGFNQNIWSFAFQNNVLTFILSQEKGDNIE